MWRLIMNEDLIDLLGRIALLGGCKTGCEDFLLISSVTPLAPNYTFLQPDRAFGNVSIVMFKLCKRNAHVGNRIKHNLLRVYNALLAMKRSGNAIPNVDIDDVLTTWKILEAETNLDLEGIQQKEANLRSMAVGGLEGCDWYKCPLQGTSAGLPREMMLCSGCKTVSGPIRSLGPWLTHFGPTGSVLRSRLPEKVAYFLHLTLQSRLLTGTEIGRRAVIVTPATTPPTPKWPARIPSRTATNTRTPA